MNAEVCGAVLNGRFCCGVLEARAAGDAAQEKQSSRPAAACSESPRENLAAQLRIWLEGAKGN